MKGEPREEVPRSRRGGKGDKSRWKQAPRGREGNDREGGRQIPDGTRGEGVVFDTLMMGVYTSIGLTQRRHLRVTPPQ